jgi:phosphatidylethanolamine-binding protein (PEBP) family uncharacterized protein
VSCGILTNTFDLDRGHKNRFHGEFPPSHLPATSLQEGLPSQAQLLDGCIQSLNQSKKVGYLGMGAAAVGAYHHYTFELFALDTKLSLGSDATQADVTKAMDGQILMKGVLVGRFHRP